VADFTRVPLSPALRETVGGRYAAGEAPSNSVCSRQRPVRSWAAAETQDVDMANSSNGL
jgi:hypothetical protein